MRDGLQPGAAHTLRQVIGAEQTADAMGNAGVTVFGTPAVVLLAEWTAHAVIKNYLEDGESAVGTRVELDHLAPALPGTTVSCTARLLNIEGRRLLYEFEVRDDFELLARGRYGSYVLHLDAFLRRAANKM